MMTLYCTYCGHVFGKGESTTDLRFELQDKYNNCPVCANPLELGTVSMDAPPGDTKYFARMHNKTR